MVGTSHDSTVRAILYAFVANFGIAIAKSWAAWLTGSEGVFNTITIQFGPNTMLAVKVKMNPGLNVNDAVAQINALERKLKARIPKLEWCFVEPDVED